MVFSSVVFLFYFLPLLFLVYCALPRFRNAILLVFSIVFYAWGEAEYTLILFFSIAVSYVFGLLVGARVWRTRIVLAAGIACNLLPLFYFKYIEFFPKH